MVLASFGSFIRGFFSSENSEMSLEDAITRAINLNDVAGLKKALSKGANPNAVDDDGKPVWWSALLQEMKEQKRVVAELSKLTKTSPYIIWEGVAEAKEALLKGAELPFWISGKKIPDMGKLWNLLSSHSFDMEVTRLLFEYGADANATDEYGCTRLMRAITSMDDIRKLWAQDFQLYPQHEWRQLIADQDRAILVTVNLLFELGADANAACRDDGMTVLMCALKDSLGMNDYEYVNGGVYKNSKLVQQERIIGILLKHGANINAVDATGKTVLEYAKGTHFFEGLFRLGATRIAKDGRQLELRSDGELWRKFAVVAAESEQLRHAAGCGDGAEVQRLLADGAPINAADEAGVTALMQAAAGGHADVVQMLVDSGADINVYSRAGDNALLLAQKHGHGEVATLLLAAGADVNAGNANGETALMLAAQRGLAETAAHLLAMGANVHAASRSGMTALMFAAANGHTKLVIRLLEAGADVNAVTRTRTTALMLAALNGHITAVHHLLRAGANPLAMDADGLTAYDLAAQGI